MARRYKTQSTYVPYSFQEMWAPAEYTTKVHNAQVESLLNTATSADSIGSQIDPNRDPEEYAVWSDYSNGLRQITNDFLENGLSTANDNAFHKSQLDYLNKIKPIETEIANRAAFAKQLHEMTLKNQHLVFAKNPNDYRLRDFRNGIPNVEFLDLEDLEKQAKTMGSMDGRTLQRALPPEQYDKYNQIVKTLSGYTLDEALSSLLDPTSKLTLLKAMLMEANGVSRFSENPAALKQIDNTLNVGLMDGAIGKMDIDIKDNGYYKDQTLAQGWARIKLSEESNKLQALKLLQSDPSYQLQSAIHNGIIPEVQYSGGEKTGLYSPFVTIKGGDSKNFLNGLLNLTTAATRGEIEIYDKKGKPITEKTIRKAIENGDTVALGFAGYDRNSDQKLSTRFTLKLGDEEYYVNPETLGLEPNMVRQINEIYGGATPTPGSNTEKLRHMTQRISENPNYLRDVVVDEKTGETALEADYRLRESFTAAAATRIFNVPNYHGTTYKTEIDKD